MDNGVSKMEMYWRIGGPFSAFKYVSKMMPDLFVVGVIIHEEGILILKERWDEMKLLIPEDYYLNYDFLEGEIEGPTYIVFDTYEQGFAFVDYIETYFNEGHKAYAAMYIDGECEAEST